MVAASINQLISDEARTLRQDGGERASGDRLRVRRLADINQTLQAASVVCILLLLLLLSAMPYASHCQLTSLVLPGIYRGLFD